WPPAGPTRSPRATACASRTPGPRSSRAFASTYGAAMESNHPSEGLPRPDGFEGRAGHQAPAAPARGSAGGLAAQVAVAAPPGDPAEAGDRPRLLRALRERRHQTEAGRALNLIDAADEGVAVHEVRAQPAHRLERQVGLPDAQLAQLGAHAARPCSSAPFTPA